MSGRILFAPFVLLAAAFAPAALGAGAVDFDREVRPVLSRNCFACHGPDEGNRKKDLRLDSFEQATRDRGGYRAIAPGDPAASALIERITAASPDARMPPVESGHALDAADVDRLRRWIAEGAEYREHWSFVKPVRHAPPAPALAATARNDVDLWILDRLEREGIAPSPPADPYALLRRLSLDLIGLPPTIAEADAFAAAQGDAAYAAAIERLLADPRFGERWARMWLDLARYADSTGYASDPPRSIWRWRDWVIDAFDANQPFDEFTRDQLAGDLLPDPTSDQLLATAFHRNSLTNTEGGTDDEEFRVAAVKDRANVTMQVWMGLTFGCAQCHSHKFDPIAQDEYYGLCAFFDQTEDRDQPDDSPRAFTPSAADRARIAELESSVAGLDAAASHDSAAELERLRAITTPVMRELPPEKRRHTHVLFKGNFLTPGPEVEPITPAHFHPWPDGAPRNRLGLARWITSRDNPLTARVFVNRVWAELFGAGLVATLEDFGTQGAPPSHPELLDLLAVDFMESGWDFRHLLRTIVTSAAYRRSSVADPAQLARDPDDRLLSRGPRFRLDAEAVRDQALFVAGLLSPKMHGPSVYPPQPDGLWRAAFNGDRTWPTSTGEDRWRRGIYTFLRRTIPYPSLAAFDAPSRETCTPRRIRTNTPLQAFVTLNDPAFVEAAQALARRVVREGGTTDDARASFALRLALQRPPAADAVGVLVDLLADSRGRLTSDPAGALALATEPLGPLPPDLDAVELAAWTVVAGIVLNQDAFLTKG